MKEKILVSACLLGIACRYDAKSKPNQNVIDLQNQYDFVAVCPETLGGLPTPRLPCEICNGRVLREDGNDCTQAYQIGAQLALDLAQKNEVKFAILKEKSPSCGSHFRYDGTFSKKLIEGMGLTAELLTKNGFSVKSENDI